MQPTITYGPIEIWHSMGTVGQLVLVALLLMSVYSTGVMIDRWMMFRRTGKQSRAFAQAARELLRDERFEATLEKAGDYPQCHLARVYAAAIQAATPDWEVGGCQEGLEDVIGNATERETVSVTQEFRRGLSSLASIASTAPFVGLFGTVIGIMNSFFGMAAAGSGGLGAVAGGIAEALVNTAAGILVALPAVWGFNHFLGRMDRIQSEMSNARSELMDYFSKRSGSSAWKLEGTTGRPVSR